ncbi:nucleoside triphosphate pyrophosphohydrolase [Thalassomonas sp. M1454]|uniref:nucleoside triphosphate pyrophosphohydrolase n=1 Tax=Thalassomonas sp. M1454 TaxID=2594477 RepID=UPI0011811D7F|nr:nucleoside triphosphate pyrophosphohydrolase [Thalassomonas sp. M1454]TRX55919.1 nucleoside triphosphate pyrophosphohydrolase [Thalassomonas sp. M1454]
MKDAPASIDKLVWIMSKLRDPKQGCPWDLKQNFQSIVPHTLEEAYEVAEAIETNDYQELEQELGDLLFQIVFYARLGQEQNRFDFSDVVSAICEKLMRRHPHIFAEESFANEAEVLVNWENEKAKERLAKNQQRSVLDDIPKALPALSQAAKIQKRCAHVGFDWDNIIDVLAKVKEEVNEVEVELNAATVNQKLVNEEIGDLLFAVVNLARHAKQDPEKLLRQASRKFTKRFQYIEQHHFQQNLDIKQSSIEYLESLWLKAKAQ